MKRVIKMLEKNNLSRSEVLKMAKILIDHGDEYLVFGNALVAASNKEETSLVLDELYDHLKKNYDKAKWFSAGPFANTFAKAKDELEDVQVIMDTIRDLGKKRKIESLVEKGMTEDEAILYYEEVERERLKARARKEVKKARTNKAMQEGVSGFKKMFKSMIKK